MRTSPAGRTGAAGLACGLLLALTLAACPGGGGNAEGEKADVNATPSADPATEMSVAAADTCTGPPPAFGIPVLNGSWAGLLDSLSAHGVTFPETPGNDTTAMVKLCQNCDSVRVEIRASNLTPCLKPSDLQGPGRRITGLFIVQGNFPAQNGWDALQPGDSLFAFTNSTGGPATLVYNQNGSGKPSPSNAWMFWYCQDGHSPGNAPRAQWRPRNPSTPGAPGEEEDGGGGTYGWMACASGCCQFYTPPPNAEFERTTPPQANPNAPDTVGGGPNPGGPGSQKPTWCKTS
ncbi:MAG TPA: hypothetical protein VFY65_11330 [Longimicrobium sp.]|nr:hypothetical protein [Longimicrobium sp.]